ncbi:LuxR C-terminal-related transcriptional regulator [Streptomyces sp. NPDC060085]|uniref:LuxR C-terminal-related transcriptional regulator n=1 Tax=Streptomyces sp. NPDC060085 TaxID=3347054 RepID=UPI003657FC77
MPGEDSAVDLLIDAADTAHRAGSLDTAARWYRCVLRIIPSGDQRIRNIETRLASTCEARGEHGLAISSLQRALMLTPVGAGTERAGTIVAIASNQAFSGDMKAALRYLDRSLMLETGLEDGGSRLTLEVHRAYMSIGLGTDVAGAARQLERTIEHARSQKLSTLHVFSMALLAWALSTIGDHQRSHAMIDETRRAQLVLPAGESSMTWLIHSFLAYVEARYVGPSAGLCELELALEDRSARGHLGGYAGILASQSKMLMDAGQVRTACSTSERAVEVARVSRGVNLIWALAEQAWAQHHAGDVHGARRSAKEAELAMQDQWVPSLWRARTRWIITRLLTPTARPQRLPLRLIDSFGGSEFRDVSAIDRPWACREMTHAALASHDQTAAARWAQRAFKEAEGQEFPLPKFHARAGWAAVALNSGDLAAAAAALNAAFDVLGDYEAPLERAELYLLRATFRAIQSIDPAPDLLSAEEIYQSCGDNIGLQKVHRERSQGHPSRSVLLPFPPGEDQFGGLSIRQLEVARLVVDGKTNQQIADQLIVSIKTVEWHLSRIFEALDVSSRSQLSKIMRSGQPPW